MGWAELENGGLLAQAVEAFELLITTDRNLRYQQNLANFKLAILVLPTTSWPIIREHTGELAEVTNTIQPGKYRELHW